MNTILNIIYCLVFLTLLTSSTQDGYVIKGSVLLDGTPYPGCKVTIVEAGVVKVTDSNGVFAFSLGKQHAKITLNVSAPDSNLSATTILENINIEKNQLELWNLPIIHNKFVSVDQYSKVGLLSQFDYLPMRCWGDIIGYYHKHEIDTARLRISCYKDGDYAIPWKYERSENKIKIDFGDWITCVNAKASQH
jgi:hypothetical protein